ncbi:MAG: LrgB family protein [Oscillospiraceae bacterium]|nr:LrgB family protein [Oscillospiraceae bacterium]
MTDLLQIGILPVVLTLCTYQLGLLLQKKVKSPVCNPILVAVVLILLFMAASGLDNGTYQSSMTSLSWLMTPATICLAIPMYEQLGILKKNLPAIGAGIAAGAVSCMFFVLAFSALVGFDRELTISLLPKSVTSAIGVPLSELSGGIAAITTPVIILTGILASVLSVPLCRLFRLTDPIAQGVALGTSGHVIGTSRANEISPLTGAVSSLSLVVAGLLTSVLFPFIITIL